MRTLTAIFLFIVAAAAAAADGLPADTLVGDWLVASHDAIIHIDGTGDGDARRYVGHIAWLKDARYHAEDGPALDGKPLIDLHNPDPALRSQPLLGLRLLWDLRREDDRWIGGRVYDADSGRTYDCIVYMTDADHLKLHGYVLHLPWLGGTSVWKRTRLPPADSPAAASSTPVG